MNKTIVTGNIGQDAEVRQVGENKVISFNVATNRKWVDSDGVVVNHTTWFNCSKWVYGKKGSVEVAKYLTKGTTVSLIGEVSASAYVSSADGKPKASLELKVEELELVSSSKN